MELPNFNSMSLGELLIWFAVITIVSVSILGGLFLVVTIIKTGISGLGLG